MKKLLLEYINQYFDLHEDGTASGIAEFVDDKIGKITHVNSLRVASAMSKCPERFRVKSIPRIPYRQGFTREITIWERFA